MVLIGDKFSKTVGEVTKYAQAVLGLRGAKEPGRLGLPDPQGNDVLELSSAPPFNGHGSSKASRFA